MTASGIDDPKQQRAVLLHLAGPGIREIFRTIPEETMDAAKVYKKAMESLNDYFKLKKNIPKARQGEMLAILKDGINVNICNINIDNARPVDKKAALRVKFPKVFEGLGKLKGYQLKLHQVDSIPAVAQFLRRIPFTRRQKVTAKMKQLEEMDVIEKVSGPTSWINPLVAVRKPNGDIRICLDMRQANRAILREKHPVPTVEET